MLALGAGLIGLAAGRGAAGSGIREGGMFRISLVGVDSVDPALAYSDTDWILLQATCAKLMNYQDRPGPAGLRPVPEVAADYPRISGGGKVYTFTLRSTFRFSNGAKVTAESFARAIERLLDPRMRSPAVDVGYLQDIVGADEFRAGKSSTPSGVVARGNRLVIRLRQPVPDFTARLTMPFFCAVPPGLPADPEGVGAYPSAGPYYVASYQPGSKVILRRNRFYRGKRPHHVNRFEVDLTPTQGEVVDRIERGEADWGWMGLVARAERGRELVRKYGVNRARLFIRPSTTLRYFVLNTERPLFRRNPRLRRAVNFAVDRAALVRQLGFRTARPTAQYLPIGFPGFRDAHVYPLKRPNLRKARALARRRLRGGKAVLYTVDSTLGLSLAQIVRRDLAEIGLKVEIRAFPFLLLFKKLHTRGEPFDISNTPGLTADYADPYAFINFLLDGRRLNRPDNANFSYFNSPKYNRLMDKASRLSGTARYRAYDQLDVRLARDAAPMVAYATDNSWTFVSKRVDRRCIVLRPELDLAAVCLKPLH
jgi:peptide/nickel transport system substrate-binding protein